MSDQKEIFGKQWQATRDYAESLPQTAADCPFKEDFVTTVLRHRASGKWFGLLMKVPGRKVGRSSEEPLELLNVKCLPEDGMIARELFEGILPAYHMNKTHWITVVLDGDVPQEFINRLIAKSYMLTRGKRS